MGLKLAEESGSDQARHWGHSYRVEQAILVPDAVCARADPLMNNLREDDRGDGQKSQKRFNVDLPHVARMPQAVKTGEVVDPRQASLLCPEATVRARNLLALLIQKPGDMTTDLLVFLALLSQIFYTKTPLQALLQAGLRGGTQRCYGERQLVRETGFCLLALS